MIKSLAIVMSLALVGTAAAQDSTSERGIWFKSLQQPKTGDSCCDIANCYRTDAEWRDGEWWAEVRGHWVAVPEETILEDMKSIDGEAYVCIANMPMGLARPLPEAQTQRIIRDGIYCFVPPIPGA